MSCGIPKFGCQCNSPNGSASKGPVSSARSRDRLRCYPPSPPPCCGLSLPSRTVTRLRRRLSAAVRQASLTGQSTAYASQSRTFEFVRAVTQHLFESLTSIDYFASDRKVTPAGLSDVIRKSNQ